MNARANPSDALDDDNDDSSVESTATDDDNSSLGLGFTAAAAAAAARQVRSCMHPLHRRSCMGGKGVAPQKRTRKREEDRANFDLEIWFCVQACKFFCVEI